MQKVFPRSEQYHKLQKNYVAAMPDKHAEITTYWILAEQYHWQGEPIEKLQAVATRLADSAALHGYSDINVAASQVSQLLQHPPLKPHLNDLQRHLQSLCSLLTIHAQGTSNTNEASGMLFTTELPHPAQTHVVCLLPNKVSYEWLFNQLKAHAFQLEMCSRPSEVTCLLTQPRTPDMILLDSGFISLLAHSELSLDHLKQHFAQIPVIFISDYNDFSSQLRAIQVGAAAHLVQPVNLAQLLKTMDELLMTEQQDIYRILLVEEEQKMALAHQATLRQQGMQTYLINSPDVLIEALVEFRPQLILLDTVLSHCSAYELATLIRREAAYLHIPIVFLLAENDEKSHLDALQAGANDTISRNVEREHLVHLIHAQIQQSQRLQALTAWDGLTGVLNREHFITHLNARIASAERAGSPVAIAILDIDQFHQINTTHGYWAGNIVLKQITRILKQRLRRGDLVGRLYGDGFIIALHDADFASAEQVLASLVKDLANIDCNVGNVSVKVTLSAGIAHYPGHIEIDKDPCFDILKTAEEAVRNAKKQGTGKVVIRSLSAAF